MADLGEDSQESDPPGDLVKSKRIKLRKWLPLRAEELKKKATPSEIRMIALLSNLEIPFDFQRVIKPYIVDFALPEYQTIIEVDGGSHIGREIYDAEREDFLRSKGWWIIRIPNEEVLADRPIKVQKELEGILGKKKPSSASRKKRENKPRKYMNVVKKKKLPKSITSKFKHRVKRQRFWGNKKEKIIGVRILKRAENDVA